MDLNQGKLKVETEERGEDEKTTSTRHHLIEAAQSIRPHGSELVGYATVFIYRNPFVNGIELIPITDLSALPENIAARAHNALMEKMLNRYGKNAPKKRGE